MSLLQCDVNMAEQAELFRLENGAVSPRSPRDAIMVAALAPAEVAAAAATWAEVKWVPTAVATLTDARTASASGAQVLPALPILSKAAVSAAPMVPIENLDECVEGVPTVWVGAEVTTAMPRRGRAKANAPLVLAGAGAPAGGQEFMRRKES